MASMPRKLPRMGSARHEGAGRRCVAKLQSCGLKVLGDCVLNHRCSVRGRNISASSAICHVYTRFSDLLGTLRQNSSSSTSAAGRLSRLEQHAGRYVLPDVLLAGRLFRQGALRFGHSCCAGAPPSRTPGAPGTSTAAAWTGTRGPSCGTTAPLAGKVQTFAPDAILGHLIRGALHTSQSHAPLPMLQTVAAPRAIQNIGSLCSACT